MSFGKLGALGRGFGRMGGGGKAGAVVIPGVITALKGTYTITGNDANLAYGRLPLTAALGTYAVTGVDATLTYSGAGSLTGQPMGLLLSLTYA
jgi:hypothetical protein